MKPGICASLLLLTLAACGKEGAGSASGVVQTGFPGQLSAGGGTSGAVMAQASGGKSASSMPSGTPGIPKGSEGNVGGAQVGGSSAQAGAEAGTKGASNPDDKEATPVSSAPATPPPREGRGSTARDAASASSSVPKGQIANSPSPAEQARKEKSQ